MALAVHPARVWCDLSHCVHSSKRPYNQRNGERVDAFRSRQAPIVAILA